MKWLIRFGMVGLVLFIAAVIWLANGCAHPQQEQVHPVAIVAWPAPVKPSCDLPPTPTPPTMVGFPIEGKVYVSVSDLIALEEFQAHLHAWAQEIQICLTKFVAP